MIRVYRLRAPFDESQATWNERVTGVSWQSPGASGTEDRESTDIGSFQMLANEPLEVEKQISLAPAQIQEMINGTFTNNGFIIIADIELNDRFNYRSSDATAASKRPKLVIEYTLSSATSTPTPTFTETPTPSATPVASGTPSPTPTASQTQTPPPQGPVTITYDYDPLYRLTAADYSTGDYYHYSYDAVGNRKMQETMIGGLLANTTYDYDDANRLKFVNGIEYLWGNNGNLLSDAVNTYTYDSANRLKTLTGPAVNASYVYNGLGDRMQETLNGQTTNFTMDLNTGLTQALSDGTHTYVYGVDRIAQVNTETEYFLGDALGSVRQMASDSGAVTYARAYDPYGVVATTSGSSQSAYGYTGEYSGDYIKLIYLRSRMYSSEIGRFLTKDSWVGDYNRPISFNEWLYVYANPINLTDPSGYSPLGQNPCDGQPNYEICYARWIVNNGGELTEEIIQSIYIKYPDETLQLIQQQFDIKLPAGYSFRQSSGGSIWGPNYEGAWGVNWWFTEFNQMGNIFEISEYSCSLLSTSILSEAIHIDYSLYITRHTFADWNYKPDDIAGIMIHEAVHAWQESVARTYILVPGLDGDPSSISWFYKYIDSMERQATDYMLDAHSEGRINVSNRLWLVSWWYIFTHPSLNNFPYSLPPDVP